jgi:hypothetical protein
LFIDKASVPGTLAGCADCHESISFLSGGFFSIGCGASGGKPPDWRHGLGKSSEGCLTGDGLADCRHGLGESPEICLSPDNTPGCGFPC